jgi:hypothetical protein
MFDVLLASNRLADAVLEDDRKAASGRQLYDDAYFAAFATAQVGAIERRINDSITAVASIIIGAWEAAGQPPLPPERPRSFRPVKPPPSPSSTATGFGGTGPSPPPASGALGGPRTLPRSR